MQSAAMLVLGGAYIVAYADAFVAPAQCRRRLCGARAALGLWRAPLLRIRPVAARLSTAMMQLDEGRAEGETGDWPSPEQIKSNVLEGTLGQRGELYVGLQFGLVFLVIIAPALSEWLESGGLVAGLAVCAAGLALGYGGVRQLGDSLSPWPKPIGPEPPCTPTCSSALLRAMHRARKRAQRALVSPHVRVYIYTHNWNTELCVVAEDPHARAHTPRTVREGARERGKVGHQSH